MTLLDPYSGCPGCSYAINHLEDPVSFKYLTAFFCEMKQYGAELCEGEEEIEISDTLQLITTVLCSVKAKVPHFNLPSSMPN